MRYNFKNQYIKRVWNKKLNKYRKVNFKTGPLQHIEGRFIDSVHELYSIESRLFSRTWRHYDPELRNEYREVKNQVDNYLRILLI